MCALDEWKVDELAALVRRAANFAELSDEVFASVLDLLAGRYPSDEFAELRPRIVWDRVNGIVRGRAGAQRLAVTSGGTIPDRGLFGVFLPDGTRVGELDEEMVYESRPGETFLLGASTWRIEDITFERVIVTPAPGPAGEDAVLARRRPGPSARARTGRRRASSATSAPGATARRRGCSDDYGLDELAAGNLVQYLDEQAEATGVVPDDRTIVVERFRDEIGDWRVCVLSPFGAQVHAPWAMALQARLAERWGIDVELLWSDDGIVLRLPEAIDELPVDELLDRSRRDRRPRHRAAAEHGAVRVALPRVRGPRAAAAPAPARPAHAAVAAAPEGGRPAVGRGEAPDVPDPARDDARVRQRRVRPAGAAHGARPSCGRARSGSCRSTRRGRRRSRSRCCSRGSPSTCTRATRRWPSAGPPRSRSTATCCATCSAPRSCASCSTPTCSPTSSSSCSASSTAAAPATPTSCTTCCGCSAR